VEALDEVEVEALDRMKVVVLDEVEVWLLARWKWGGRASPTLVVFNL